MPDVAAYNTILEQAAPFDGTAGGRIPDINVENSLHALLSERALVNLPFNRHKSETSAQDLEETALALNVERLHQRWHDTRGLLDSLTQEENDWLTVRKKLEEQHAAFKKACRDLGLSVRAVLDDNIDNLIKPEPKAAPCATRFTTREDVRPDLMTDVSTGALDLVGRANGLITHKLHSIADRRFRPAQARDHAIRVLQLALDSCDVDANRRFKNICSICFHNTVDSFVIPCGHTFCSECAGKGAEHNCPVCRTAVTKISKLFFSDGH